MSYNVQVVLKLQLMLNQRIILIQLHSLKVIVTRWKWLQYSTQVLHFLETSFVVAAIIWVDFFWGSGEGGNTRFWW